jgi:hypothetical protein
MLPVHLGVGVFRRAARVLLSDAAGHGENYWGVR